MSPSLAIELSLCWIAAQTWASTLEAVRMTMFWDRMNEFFGENYAESVAKDHVIAGLGGRTVSKALADGEDAKIVWRAVCETFNVPDSQRLLPSVTMVPWTGGVGMVRV
jgi:hypothetical protein